MPPETSENQMFSGVSREYAMGTLVGNSFIYGFWPMFYVSIAAGIYWLKVRTEFFSQLFLQPKIKA